MLSRFGLPQGSRALSLLLACCATFSAKGNTLLYDNFETNPYHSGSMRWNLYRSDSSQTYAPGPFSGPYYANWLASGGINGTGYIFTQQQPNALETRYLVHAAPEALLSFDLQASGIQSLSLQWDENRSSLDGVARRVALRIDDQWFVSERTDVGSSLAQRMDFTNTAWFRLQATPGASSAMSFDASLAYRFHELATTTGKITSVGFYTELPASDGTTRTMRYDHVHLTTGLDWVGGSGNWSTTEPQKWVTGGLNPEQTGNWSNHEVAAFGARGSEASVGTVTVTGNVSVRALEFYQHADGATLLGNAGLNEDTSPIRNIQINNEYAFRSLYIAPQVQIHVGGDAETGLRIYRSNAPLHLYGGGTLNLERNSMVRSEGGGNVILNGGTTVIVKTGAAFNASRDLYLGNAIDTQDGSSGSATLILDGGTSLTRTGSVGGDLVLGGSSGQATLIVKNLGHFTTHLSATTGVKFQGTSTIRLESGGRLSTRQLNVASDFNGNANIILDGGVLHMNSPLPSGQSQFLNHASVQLKTSTQGAIFDTGGREMIFRNPLLHDDNGSATDGGLTVRGGGTVFFDLPTGVASTFNGKILVENSTLKISRFEALGTAGNAATNLVLDGGTLFVTGSGIATNREVTLTANGGTYKSSGNSRIHGKIVGAAGATLKIEGSAWLSGDSQSSFHGDIEVLSGEFLVRRAASLGSTTGGLTIRSGATFSVDHNGTGGGGNNINDNQYADALVLEENTTFLTRGRASDGNGTATFYSGQITLGGPGHATFRVYNANASSLATPNDILDLTVTGAILGQGGLTKTGGGKMILTNTNAYTGSTLIQEGTLALQGNGSIASQHIEISENARWEVTQTSLPYLVSQQSISGKGTVAGAIKIGSLGEVQAGMSQNHAAGNLIGTLTFLDEVQFFQGSRAVFQLSSTSQYDQLDFQSQLSVFDGTSFEVQWLNFEAALGDSFNLMTWDSVQWDPAFQQHLLSQLILPTFSNASLAWDTSNFLSNGIISVIAVPEPSVSMLATLASTTLLFIRKRRRSLQRPPRTS